jgi:hypothetical protein
MSRYSWDRVRASRKSSGVDVGSVLSTRIRRTLGLMLSVLVVISGLAVPASAQESSTSPSVYLFNNSSANWCVWGNNTLFWVQGNPFIVLNGYSESGTYNCNTPKGLPADFLAVKASLWYGGWPNLHLCAQFPVYGINAQGDSQANQFDPPAPCGNVLYWGIGYHVVYLFPGFWSPNPPANSISGPVDGCYPNCPI